MTPPEPRLPDIRAGAGPEHAAPRPRSFGSVSVHVGLLHAVCSRRGSAATCRSVGSRTPPSSATGLPRTGRSGRRGTSAGSGTGPAACAVCPKTDVADRYTGPWRTRTPNPVLVLGSYFHPATDYSGAVAASNLLPSSRLLSCAGWGNTAFFGGNYCVDAVVARRGAGPCPGNRKGAINVLGQ